jgi:PKHD-type hydroxylase
MKLDYITRPSFYSLDQCQSIAEKLATEKEIGLNDAPAGRTIKTAQVDLVAWKNAREYLGELEDAVALVNQQMFGFEIYKMSPFECVNFNQYHDSEQGEYSWHKDSIKNELYDYKLTVIANISTEAYRGGHFELFLNEPLHIKEFDEPGCVIVIPSYTQHRVTPVTNGVRKTVSFWIRGPAFR